MGWIEAARWAVKNSQFVTVHPITGERVDTPKSVYNTSEDHEEKGKTKGVILDAYSASVMVQVYDALKPEVQEKFEKVPVAKAQKIAFGVLK